MYGFFILFDIYINAEEHKITKYFFNVTVTVLIKNLTLIHLLPVFNCHCPARNHRRSLRGSADSHDRHNEFYQRSLRHTHPGLYHNNGVGTYSNGWMENRGKYECWHFKGCSVVYIYLILTTVRPRFIKKRFIQKHG